MAKTNLDRLRIIAQLCKGENVTENFNSERTAKAEWNKMLGFKVNNWVFEDLGRVLREWGTDNYLYKRALERFGVVDDEVISLVETIVSFCKENVCDLTWQYISASEKSDGEYEVFFASKKRRTLGQRIEGSGIYTATCKSVTNTKKYQQFLEYDKAVSTFIEEVGLRFSPDTHLFKKYKYGDNTEHSYQKSISMVLDKIPQYKEPCSEKQAYYIAKNMRNVSVEQALKLNKGQASELLDCIFNMCTDNPYYDDIMNHYREILS